MYEAFKIRSEIGIWGVVGTVFSFFFFFVDYTMFEERSVLESCPGLCMYFDLLQRNRSLEQKIKRLQLEHDEACFISEEQK